MLLKQRGKPSERIRKARKQRMGIGWEYDPLRASSVAPAPPAALQSAPSANRSSIGHAADAVLASAPRSALSATAPSALSCTAPSALSASRLAFPAERASRDEGGGTQLSVAAPSQLSAVASQLSRCSSVPSELLRKDPATWLHQREEKCDGAMKELGRYAVKGARGNKWNHPVGQTDVTRFSDNFTKCTGGVPLYKYYDR